MKIFNSYSEKKEDLDLSEKIGIYVCGITPYDTTHLGHAFTFLTYDVLVRYLSFLGADVTYVQNNTDVDDSILTHAKSLGINWKKLGLAETKKHLKNMDALNALWPDVYPKASDYIPQMQEIIKVLFSKNLAYVKNGNVYFEVKKDKNFGKLSKLDYRAQLEIANERGNFPLDSNKRNPLDFVLWEKSREGEPTWNSPWGKGRPGWHIECSAMSLEYLGPTITIHGGGEDLIFPHHEAEIAQSENYTGVQFVKIWMHTAMVYSDGQKMSKSLGNMIFVSDLLKKYTPNAVRIYLLSHNYRKPWNFEESGLARAEEVAQVLEENSEKTKLEDHEARKLLPGFFAALDNDLYVPLALSVLTGISKSREKRVGELITKCGQMLGLVF